MIKVRVPATSANLGPGFDTLGVALEMYNEIEMAETGILDDVIEVEGHSGGMLEEPQHNLVYQAARLAFDRLGYRPYGLLLRERIGIPVARGLGSSAAAIVAGLVGASVLSERATGRGLSQEEILELAVQMEGHPDNVTPALVGGFTVACMDEGRPLFVRFDPPAGLEAVVAIPEIPLPTKTARGVLPGEVTMADAVFNLSRATLLVAALLTGRLDLLAAATKDRMHQPYREALVPGLRAVIQAALDAGARGVALSGAGPSVIALVERGNQEPVQSAMEAAFQWHGSDCTVRAVALAREGARVESAEDRA